MTTVGNEDAVHLLHVEYEVGACCVKEGFPGGSDGEEPACNMGDLGLIPGLGRSPGEERLLNPVILAGRIP